jgi:hypothetical protein
MQYAGSLPSVEDNELEADHAIPIASGILSRRPHKERLEQTICNKGQTLFAMACSGSGYSHFCRARGKRQLKSGVGY